MNHFCIPYLAAKPPWNPSKSQLFCQVRRWGEFATGEAGRFDKDDLVQAVYPGSQEVYCAQVGGEGS